VGDPDYLLVILTVSLPFRSWRQTLLLPWQCMQHQITTWPTFPACCSEQWHCWWSRNWPGDGSWQFGMQGRGWRKPAIYRWRRRYWWRGQ